MLAAMTVSPLAGLSGLKNKVISHIEVK